MTIDTLGSLVGARTERGFVAADTTAVQQVGRQPATAVETPAAVTAKAPASMDELKSAVDKLNESMQTNAQSLEFSIDEDSKRTIVKVIDQNTKEVVRQFPSEDALRIAKSLDNFKGLLISQQA